MYQVYKVKLKKSAQASVTLEEGGKNTMLRGRRTYSAPSLLDYRAPPSADKGRSSLKKFFFSDGVRVAVGSSKMISRALL